MDVITRIRQALDSKPVDATELERCACALLQGQYRGLSAIEGGHDRGRDGDIYFPLSARDPAARGRLLVTTGDPVANVRNGLKRMKEEDLRVDQVVVACLQEVNDHKRQALQRLCTEAGLGEPHVYGRDWFVERLVQESAWRVRLLGVHGELGALLDKPLSLLERPTAAPALTGRDDLRAEITALLGAREDLVLTGVPGVGKTRLTTELQLGVKFLQTAERHGLVDDLLTVRPTVVVVDDAHTDLDQLSSLRHARAQERLGFSIVATTWPDRVDEVSERLPHARVVKVPLLELPDMDVIVRAAGVHGHRARALVLDQAAGRPGWGLTLCALLHEGRGRDVMTGSAHAGAVEAFLRRTTESETALDVLACTAALGAVDAETMQHLASLAGVQPPAVRRLFERMATNGLLEQQAGAWSVQPALRAPLVARWFFAEMPWRPWSTLSSIFAGRSLDLVRSAVGAARTGSRAAHREVDAWFGSLPEPAMWDEATIAVVAERAILSQEAAREAVDAATTILAGPGQPETILEATINLRHDGARSVVTQAARQWALPEAVHALLDLAVVDHRPRSQTSDHPLRVLGDAARRVDPDHGADVSMPRALLEVSAAWLAGGGETLFDARCLVFAELVVSLLSPVVSLAWTDPGQPSAMTFGRGADTAENLKQLVNLWTQVEAILRSGPEEDGRSLPVGAVVHLLDLAGQWLRLGEGFPIGTGDTTTAQRALGAQGGRSMITALFDHVQAVPGLALRAQHMIDLLDRPSRRAGDLPSFSVDPDLVALLTSAVRDRGQSVEALIEAQDAGYEHLASRFAAMDPVEGARSFEELIAQARLVSEHENGEFVARRMQKLIDEPLAWFDAAMDSCNSVLTRAAVARCLADGFVVPAGRLADALAEPALRAGVVTAVLDRDVVDAVTTQVLDELHSPDARLFEWTFARNGTNEVMHLLLWHPLPVIAGTTAVGFGVGEALGPALPDAWRPEWRDVVRSLRPADLPHHSKWRAQKLLEHLVDDDPDLYTEWCLGRLADDFLPISSWSGDNDSEQHLARLPREHRERLARRCSQLGYTSLGGSLSLLDHLIGRDRGLAEKLLDDGTLTVRDVVEAVFDHRDKVLETLGPLLLERGGNPDEIARSAGFISWSDGCRSREHVAAHDYFADLAKRVPALAAVAQAGCRQQVERQRKEEVDERRERVRLR